MIVAFSTYAVTNRVKQNLFLLYALAVTQTHVKGVGAVIGKQI